MASAVQVQGIGAAADSPSPAGGFEEEPDSGLLACVLDLHRVHAAQVSGADGDADLLEGFPDHRVLDGLSGFALPDGRCHMPSPTAVQIVHGSWRNVPERGA